MRVFAASRSRRGDKGRNDRKFLESLHYFVVHNITWRALPEKFGHWNSVWKRFWRCFRNRLGIPVAILLRFHIGPDVLRRHQAQKPPQMMGAATSLHCDNAGRQLDGHRHDGLALHAAPQNDLAGRIKVLTQIARSSRLLSASS
jgi:transposase